MARGNVAYIVVDVGCQKLNKHDKLEINYRYMYYRQPPNISRTLLGNKIVDHSDVVGASPLGAAPPTSSFST